MNCPEGEKQFQAAQAIEAQLRGQIAAASLAIRDADAAAARQDFNAMTAALKRASQAAAKCPNLKAQGDAAYAAAATEFKKCADGAFERGDLRRAVDLYRAARACGAANVATNEATAEEFYKRAEREHDDRIKPAPRPTGADSEAVAAPIDPANINVQNEQRDAANEEQAAENQFSKNPPDPIEASKKLISAARHHRNAGRHEEVLGDPCVAADEFAAASDDYAKAAEIQIEAGNAYAAFRDQLEAADLAEQAAKLYEQCAQNADASGNQHAAMRFWSSADTCWERVWLFWDRMYRYWRARQARARDEDDPDEAGFRRHADEALKRSAEADRRSVNARERMEADAEALKPK